MIADETLRIGVYVCHCGSNIAGVVDVQKLGPLNWSDNWQENGERERALEEIVAALFDIVFWPVAVDAKVRDVENMPDAGIDVCLFNGGIVDVDGS